MHLCNEEDLFSHLSSVLFEYLGEEFPDVLGSILRALRSIVEVMGLDNNIELVKPPVVDLLPRLTPILKNRHEKVQENCILLVGRIAEHGAKAVSSREWMRICFELLELLKAPRKAIRKPAVSTFGFIAQAIALTDFFGTFLNNWKLQERTQRVCTTVSLALAGLSGLPLAAGAYGWVDDHSRLPSKASPAPEPTPAPASASAPPKKQPDFTRTAGIAVADLFAGTGPSLSDGDFVIVDFVAFLKSGVVFDNTKQPGRKSLVFQIGGNKVIPGLETAIKGMAMGGRRIAIIPPELAYGERGACFPDQGCLAPPGETIEYDITLNRIINFFNYTMLIEIDVFVYLFYSARPSAVISRNECSTRALQSASYFEVCAFMLLSTDQLAEE